MIRETTLVVVLPHSFENNSNNKIVAYVPVSPVCPSPVPSPGFAVDEAAGVDCVPDGVMDCDIDGCMDSDTDGVTDSDTDGVLD